MLVDVTMDEVDVVILVVDAFVVAFSMTLSSVGASCGSLWMSTILPEFISVSGCGCCSFVGGFGVLDGREDLLSGRKWGSVSLEKLYIVIEL